MTPKRVPRRRLYHENWRFGYRQNSTHGNDIAKRQGKNWLDNDGHLSARVAPMDGRPGSPSIWVNAHGAPEKAWGRERFEAREWKDLSKLHIRRDGRVYELRNARRAFQDAAKRGQSLEWEIKDVRPWDRPEFILDSLKRLVRHAEESWGKSWPKHLNVKMVSTIGGGLDYVLPIMALAHSLGIPTLLTVRGKHRFRRNWPAYITYVRGSAVIR